MTILDEETKKMMKECLFGKGLILDTLGVDKALKEANTAFEKFDGAKE